MAAAPVEFAGIEEQSPVTPQIRQNSAGGWTPDSFCHFNPLYKCFDFFLSAVGHKYVCYANLIEKKTDLYRNNAVLESSCEITRSEGVPRANCGVRSRQSWPGYLPPVLLSAG